MKKISSYWSLLAGLLSVAAQVGIFYFRFGRLNTDSMVLDYLLFLVAGTIGGWILVFFLNRQMSTAARLIVLAAFLIATPIAFFFMIGGGLFGWIGVLVFPQIPWALLTWIGSLAGKLTVKR